MRLISLLSLLAVSQLCFAQEKGINIQQDPRIDTLMQRQVEANKARHGVEGFRVQIHFGQSRERAQKIRADFSAKYPDLKTYLGYDSPYYKIRVGDFIDRLSAYQVQKLISSSYRGAYIVPTTVDFEELTKKEPLNSDSSL
jgi:hypothetical protein